MSKEKTPIRAPEKICPECGQDVTGRDIDVHARGHWGENKPDPRKFPEAAKRHKILMSFKGGA